MTHVVWSQWDNLQVPDGFMKLSPHNRSLDNDDLSDITFYVPQYMGGQRALAYAQKMPNLKYFQLPNAGYEDALEYLAPGVILCNARGVHDASTGELAVGLAIAARRGFADFAKAQTAGKWAHKRYPSLSDSRILIIGAGSIAQTIERFLTPYDVAIQKFSRSGSNNSLPISDLDHHLPQADIVILALPLNKESMHLFDKRRLALLKDGATLVNVARGGIVDTEALVAELNNQRISAGLDVTDPEPLPEGHPLWKASNCVIAPHVGGDSTAFESRGKKLVEDQLKRLSRGESLINIVSGATQ
jgi:phosphoglycerate dehydrogenase-like enzyme